MLDDCGRKASHFCDNIPGKSWWYGFVARHPDIKLSIKKRFKRLLVCTETSIRNWFKCFLKEIDEHNICDPNQIFNCDEYKFPLRVKSGKVITSEFSKYWYHRTSSNAMQVSALICFNAAGRALSPLVVFPGKYVKGLYAADLPQGSSVFATDRGLMTPDAFYHWLKTAFIPSLPPKSERGNIMLLLDDNLPHKDYRACKMCQDENVVLFCLPSHLAHILQPLDKAYFSPFKTHWKTACARFFNQNQVVVDKVSFGRVFQQALSRTVQTDLITESFECCGFWPANPDRIDYDEVPHINFFSKPTEVSESMSFFESSDAEDDVRSSTVPRQPANLFTLNIQPCKEMKELQPGTQETANVGANSEIFQISEVSIQTESRLQSVKSCKPSFDYSSWNEKLLVECFSEMQSQLECILSSEETHIALYQFLNTLKISSPALILEFLQKFGQESECTSNKRLDDK